MKEIKSLYQRIDILITTWMSHYGILMLRLSLGIIYLWFGILKFFPGMSPAQSLAIRTMDRLTFGWMSEGFTLKLLATWESVIGLGLILGIGMRFILLLLFVQMIGTITPLFLFPEEVFFRIPFAPTLEGQYILKNLVIISAAIVIGATVRGGRLVADPKRVRQAKE